MEDYMKTFFLLSILALTSFQTFAKAKDCSLYISNPKISHTMYGQNNGQNSVNSGVISILTKNGFSVVKNISKAKYELETTVRCTKNWSFFGLQDFCSTEIMISDLKEEKIVYTDGPTAPIMGLNIDFNNVRFPNCQEL